MLEPRFTSKYAVNDQGCWIWQAVKDRRGYGIFMRSRSQAREMGVGRNIGAHRYAYEVLVGPIPEGLVLDHLCRVPSCVNPAHLEPVTHLENVRRGAGVGMALWDGTPARKNHPTHCPHGHEYAAENIYWSGPNRTQRKCRICTTERVRLHYRRTKVYKRPRATDTHCCHGHEMTPQNTYRNGGRVRCRECVNASQRAYQARKKAG